MPTASNQILLTYWLILPESDHTSIEDMRAAGEQGVSGATFARGEKRLLQMEARFDSADPAHIITASQYALRNAKSAAAKEHPGATVWSVEVWLNGEKVTTEKIQP